MNLADRDESDVKPADELVMSAETVTASAAGAGGANLPLWPWLVIVALALVCLEWWAYNAKVRI